MLKCWYAEMLNTGMLKCKNAEMLELSIAQMLKFSISQMLKLSSLLNSLKQCQITVKAIPRIFFIFCSFLCSLY